jgi:hypothetical protein
MVLIVGSNLVRSSGLRNVSFSNPTVTDHATPRRRSQTSIVRRTSAAGRARYSCRYGCSPPCGPGRRPGLRRPRPTSEAAPAGDRPPAAGMPARRKYHDRPDCLRGNHRRPPPGHQHPGTVTDPPRRPATRRPRTHPADRRRDQTPDQPGHPNRATAGPPPAMVVVATPTPSPRPLVSPSNSATPQPSTSTNMTRSRSAAPVLVLLLQRTAT